MKRIVLMFVLGMAVVPAASQTSARKPAFEVASVKRNNSGSRALTFGASPGRFTAQNVMLRMLIKDAYDVQDFQVSGGPDWINSDRYDIEAKAQDRASSQQIEGPMLQSLLEDRFKLVVHREMKELPVYEMTVAKGGAKLKSGSC